MADFVNIEAENSDFSDIDDDSHKKLIKNVLNISGKPAVLHPTRTEPSLKISEYDVVRHNNRNVHLGDLASVLQRKCQQHVSKQIKRLTQKTLAKHLEKPKAERIHRSVTYKKAQLELDKWDPIVASMRSSSSTQFPLHSDAKIKENDADKADWGYKNNLQKELLALESKEEVFIMPDEGEFIMSTEEIAEKRREAAKMRAHESFKIAKARHQNKIKSKKYHRVQKKVRIKQQMKEFELLQKTNPEAALEKLEEIERARAEERMSLRHKSTGQWAKSKLVRAKYDKESRQVLAQQLAISRDLMQKLKTAEDSDSETDITKPEEVTNAHPDNPWVNPNIKISKDVDNFLGTYRKYWENQHEKEEPANEALQENNYGEVQVCRVHNVVLKEKKITKNVKTNAGNVRRKGIIDVKATKQRKTCTSTSEWDVTDVLNGNTDVENELNKVDSKMLTKIAKKYQTIKKSIYSGTNRTTINSPEPEHSSQVSLLSLPKVNLRPVIDEALDQSVTRKKKTISSTFPSLSDLTCDANHHSSHDDEISPNKFVKLSTALDTALPDLMELEDNDDRNNNDVISEAFQNDDIIDNFHKEKQDEIKANQPKNIDLLMAGWGSWGGKNIKISKNKKKRFILKFPQKMPRKDSNRGDLIINESGNSKAKPHLVSEVPFPFKNVKDYEASIRAPIGSTFVPETAVRRLTQPAVLTKLGTIIEPMTRDVLIQKKK